MGFVVLLYGISSELPGVCLCCSRLWPTAAMMEQKEVEKINGGVAKRTFVGCKKKKMVVRVFVDQMYLKYNGDFLWVSIILLR